MMFSSLLMSCLVLSCRTCCLRYDNYSRPSNPFLVPLTKYLDRYATETMDYFLEKERLGKSSFAGLLVRATAVPYRTVTVQELVGYRNAGVQLMSFFEKLASCTLRVFPHHNVPVAADVEVPVFVHVSCVSFLSQGASPGRGSGQAFAGKDGQFSVHGRAPGRVLPRNC